jgi:hypothetical protein
MGKKLGLILGAIVALGLLAVTAVLLLLDVNQYRDLIEARLEGPLGRDVTLGEMSLGLFPPRFEVAPASIAEGPAFPGPSPFIETDRLAVRVGLFQLIRDNVRIDSLDLDRPRVELIRSADGTWNFSTLGASAGDAGETTPGGDAAPSFALGRLRISDGQVAVTGADGTRAVYDHIDITLRDFVPGEPFSFDLAAHLPGEGAQELRLEGTGGPFATAAPMETPFGGTLALHEVGMDGLRAFLGTEMLVSSGGALSGETALDSTGGVVAASGSLRLDDARFNGVEVGYPVELDYALEARLAEGLYVFEEATLGLGSAPLSLTGQVDTGADPTRLDLRFRASDVPIEEAARLASSSRPRSWQAGRRSSSLSN